MNIVNTIIPIFALIIMGWAAKKKGFMPPEFLAPANRLVYYLAIPAMIFRAISRTDFYAQFNSRVLACTLIAILAVFVVAWIAGLIFRISRMQIGTFIQTSVHGNLGYIAFAVAFYFLGSEGLVRASIIGGFVMILQNFLAVIALQVNSNRGVESGNISKVILAILGNPVIVSAMGGILFSIIAIPIPLIINRCLDILSSLALPMALLLIGGSLSFERMRSRIASILSSGMLKLILLPALGVTLYRLLNLTLQDYLPGLIILASPTATVTFVMAKEMNGDADFAVAAISASTIFSAVTFSVWLNFAG